MPPPAPLPPPSGMTAADLADLTADQVAALPASQVGELLKRQDELRWAAESPYFRDLHALLPEPFFHTSGFVFFTLAVGLTYWLIPRRWNTARVWLLVVASFHFYAAWNAGLAFLVTGTATADFLFARLMGRTANRRVRLTIAAASVGLNLGVLAYFKYRGFFLNELHDFLGHAGVPAGFDKLTPLDILIPFGISFYTFEAISYAVDVYKRKIPAERSLPHFLLFILFFPHLVAGPIVRAGDFLRQTRRVKRWNWVRVQVGVEFILIGLIKKLAVADRMAVFSDPVLADPAGYNASSLWLATLAYALRIYADFSGYSDMAVGVAHLFGYKLVQNFNMPYLAMNIADFWRRWHMSLSAWLRDYVFIPLGGSRGSALATDRNLMITMLLGGLWHGSTWGYVVWGGLHGLLLVGHRHFRAFAVGRPRLTAALDTLPGLIARTALTMFCVSILWVFFQPDLSKALLMLERMATLATDGTKPLPLHNRSLWYTVIALFACQIIVTTGAFQRAWAALPPVAVGIAYAAGLNLALVLAPEQGQSFIYFTF